MRWWSFAVCVACGCGRIGFSQGTFEAGGTGDGAIGDGVVAPGDGALPDIAPAGACPATVRITDDFADGVMGAPWSLVSGTGLTVAETGGFLQITFASNVPAGQSGGYVTATTMDWTNTCIVVEVVMVPNAAGGGEIEAVIGAGQNVVSMYAISGTLGALLQNGAQVHRMTPALTYDPVAQRWWRMRNTSASWYFEVSPDDTTYTTIYTWNQNETGQTSQTLKLIALSGSAVGNGGVAQFGSVNVTGP